MTLNILKKTLQASVFTLITFGSPIASASTAFLIDDFSDRQEIADEGGDAVTTTSTPLALSPSASDVAGIRRTLSATALGNSFANLGIQVGEFDGPGNGGSLAVSNSSSSVGTASIFWDGFAPTDLTTVANAIRLQVLSVDLNTSVELIVNGISSSGTKTFTGPEDFWVSFSDFSVPTAFTAVHSLRLNLTGPGAWDGEFRLLTATMPVPLPSALPLMSLALAAWFGFSGKRIRR